MADHLHQWWEDPATKVWLCATCGIGYGDRFGPLTIVVHDLPDRQKAVMDVLKDGQWHDGPELTHPAVGGSEGLRRLRELRAKGYDIEMRRKAKGRTTRQYRLVR